MKSIVSKECMGWGGEGDKNKKNVVYILFRDLFPPPSAESTQTMNTIMHAHCTTNGP